ncbi:Rft-1-domain-containing protein [Leucogyrophana mollusca]|uniref:Rft-1-domain-containing protein n=1 Tax=Leucogyrophana mollusca TaxID=85980 RepID=A0ACB8BQ01_9AGAM|nr:Rft-1-domain-containing protein [Leucogyrophana mollusca]
MASRHSAAGHGSRLMKASISSASSLVGLQLFSRGFTFILNQALFRLASPQVFGTAAIQFELVLSTILFLSREGVRNALLRAWPSPDEPNSTKLTSVDTVKSTNLASVPALIGLPVAITTVCLYGYAASADTQSQPRFRPALWIYALAAVGELCSEPMHNRAMGEVRTHIRVRAEGLGITCKTIITYVALLYDSKQGHYAGTHALEAFALGQLTYSTVVFAVYVIHFGWPSLWPKRLQHRSLLEANQGMWKTTISAYFDPTILQLSMTMTSQSVVKHFLTEGDKLIVSWWSPLQDQGGYAIAVNYGSLVARIILQPVEEICRVFFSKVLSSSNTSAAAPSRARSGVDASAMQQASEALMTLLSVQLVFSFLVVTFGSLYLPIFLNMLLPRQYISTSAPGVLSAWIWYIPFLAINGGLEAFFSSVATPKDLNRQSRWLIVFSAIYLLAAITLYNLHFGDTSLVYANIINLTARIGYVLNFASSYFKGHERAYQLAWRTLMPTWQFIAVSVMSLFAISCNGRRIDVMDIVATAGRKALLSSAVAMHVALGAGLGILSIATWWTTAGNSLISRTRAKTA